ncbi:MAG: ribosome-associated protein [Zhongshania sp.]|jgi:ribosome-associated protein
MDVEQLKKVVINALEDVKGRDIVVLDVRGLSSVTDYMVMCSGTSNRHVKSLADNVWVEVKKRGEVPLGMEGQDTGDWVLVDLGDVMVHVMLPEARLFYDLERLWQVPAPGSDAS